MLWCCSLWGESERGREQKSPPFFPREQDNRGAGGVEGDIGREGVRGDIGRGGVPGDIGRGDVPGDMVETAIPPTIFALFRFPGTSIFCYPSNGIWPF